jgi:hypothetical protein
VKQALLTLVLVCVSTTSSYGEHITVGAGHTEFKFQNGVIVNGNDITFELLTAGQTISLEGSMPGGVFFQHKALNATGTLLTFNQGNGAGVAGLAGTYTVDFVGWAEGTVFDVKYSHPGIDPTDPGVTVVAEGPPFDGEVVAVPEPSAMLIGCTAAFIGLAYAWRRFRRGAQNETAGASMAPGRWR